MERSISFLNRLPLQIHCQYRHVIFKQSQKSQLYPLFSSHYKKPLCSRKLAPSPAFKAVQFAADVPNQIDHVNENIISLSLSRFSTGLETSCNKNTASFKPQNKFMVIGHRGHGMNLLQSTDNRMKAIKENTISSFNAAAKLPLDFIEFDVQVTKDNCPVIFHDDVIVSEDNGTVFEKRITELSLSEFLSYGHQKTSEKNGKTLLRKTYDGKIVIWNVETEDSLCTQREAFEQVNPSLGFNIELKFDDFIVYNQEYLINVLQSILKVVFECAKDRPIIFSSFQPDAIQLVRKLQSTYPVFFLTDGGTEIYHDVRRNSLEEAIKLCRESGLQGIVSEIKGVFRNPGTVSKIKDAKLSLLTYGKLNNMSEAVYLQHMMGIDGVIVDFVQEITASVTDMIKPTRNGVDKGVEEKNKEEVNSKLPKFSQHEMAFLLSLIPKLVEL